MTLIEWADSGLVPLSVEATPKATVRLPLLDELLLVWPTVAGMLHKATIRTGCYEPVDLLKMAMNGQAGIWVCEVDGRIVAALATEVRQYPRRRVLQMLFCGGAQMREWLKPAMAAMDRHARDAGCSHVAAAGRPGWARVCGGRLTGDVVAVRHIARGIET